MELEDIEDVYAPYWLVSDSVRFRFSNNSSAVNARSRRGEASFRRLPYHAFSEGWNKGISNVEPYDYSALTPYSPKAVEGHRVLDRDLDADPFGYWMSSRILWTLWNADPQDPTRGGEEYDLDPEVYEYSSLQGSPTVEPVLLPLWLFTFDYDGELYGAWVNGQTGRVYSEIPIIGSPEQELDSEGESSTLDEYSDGIGWLLGIVILFWCMDMLILGIIIGALIAGLVYWNQSRYGSVPLHVSRRKTIAPKGVADYVESCNIL